MRVDFPVVWIVSFAWYVVCWCLCTLVETGITLMSGGGWLSYLLKRGKRNDVQREDEKGAAALLNVPQTPKGVLQDDTWAIKIKKTLLKLVGSVRLAGESGQIAMAAPRDWPQHLPPAEATERKDHGMWQLYNFLIRRTQKEKMQEDAQDVADAPDVPQSSKDVVQDESLVKNFTIRIQPVDTDSPPKLSKPLPVPVTPRDTPPQLSPIEGVGLQAVHYNDARCSTESEASNSDSPQLPSSKRWKYELLPTSDSSPTAIRAKLTRNAQAYDDSNDDERSLQEENDFSEDAEDALCQQDGP
ncbi:uncharacterized protein LOC126298813 [Schistocerca gregaria]|uniref:uncharacterized protein LOC126298813 n=1 Tax=Schistocerca gregaria TaxID=7010 RepID=UPI00211E710B|nr:uncharacterized protein LOC126298813 [Schistocerca gregaria]